MAFGAISETEDMKKVKAESRNPYQVGKMRLRLQKLYAED